MYRRRKTDNKIREAYEDDRYVDYVDSKRYVRSKGDSKVIKEDRSAEDDIVYVPDEKDPSVLRRARVERRDH